MKNEVSYFRARVANTGFNVLYIIHKQKKSALGGLFLNLLKDYFLRLEVFLAFPAFLAFFAFAILKTLLNPKIRLSRNSLSIK